METSKTQSAPIGAPEDRIAQLEQQNVDLLLALQAVTDCIMGTRGPDATEAVEKACALLAGTPAAANAGGRALMDAWNAGADEGGMPQKGVCISPLATRPILYADTINGGQQALRDDLWAVTTAELNALHLARPAAADAGDVCAEMRALCPNCGGTGDVHRMDGEWLGECNCEASKAHRATATSAGGLLPPVVKLLRWGEPGTSAETISVSAVGPLPPDGALLYSAPVEMKPVAVVNDRYSRDGYNDEISALLPVGTQLYVAIPSNTSAAKGAAGQEGGA